MLRALESQLRILIRKVMWTNFSLENITLTTRKRDWIRQARFIVSQSGGSCNSPGKTWTRLGKGDCIWEIIKKRNLEDLLMGCHAQGLGADREKWRISKMSYCFQDYKNWVRKHYQKIEKVIYDRWGKATTFPLGERTNPGMNEGESVQRAGNSRLFQKWWPSCEGMKTVDGEGNILQW